MRIDRLLEVLAAVAVLAPRSTALRCYDGGRGYQVVMKNCESCNFCAIAIKIDPEMRRTGDANLSYMAVGESELGDEQTALLQAMLREGSQEYKLLSTCIVESYDFSRFTKKKPIELVKPEVMLRCFCNYDRCNKARSVADFWARLARMETVAVRARLEGVGVQEASEEINLNTVQL